MVNMEEVVNLNLVLPHFTFQTVHADAMNHSIIVHFCYVVVMSLLIQTRVSEPNSAPRTKCGFFFSSTSSVFPAEVE